MIKDFWNHIKKNRSVWAVLLIFLSVTQGLWLLSGIIGVDTELFYDLGEEFYGGWISLFRHGLVLLSKLFGGRARSPRTIGIFSLVFIEIACILWTYLLSKVTKKQSLIANLSFSLVIASAPIISEQLYFICQSMEFTFGLCLSAAGLILLYDFAKTRKAGFAIASIPLLALTFTEYQAFVALFIVGASVIFFLEFAFNTDEKDTKEIIKFTAAMALDAAIALFAGVILPKIVFSRSGGEYLSNQIYWDYLPVSSCIKNIVRHFGSVFLGYKKHYPHFYVFFALFPAAGIIADLKKRNKIGKVFAILSYFILMVSPFALTVFMGGQPVLRAQFPFTFLLGALIWGVFCRFDYKDEKEKSKNIKIFRIITAILLIFTVAEQTYVTERLIFSEYSRNREDLEIAEEIAKSIAGFENEEGNIPVAIIGKPSFSENRYTGESFGHSIFSLDHETEPRFYYSSRRMAALMHLLGYQYPQAGEEIFKEVSDFTESLPAWPEDESIIIYKDTVVVNLGYSDN